MSFDTHFASGAKIFLESLEENGRIGRVPVIVITADAMLREDRYLRSRCEFKLLKPDEDSLSNRVAVSINRPEPRDPMNRAAYYAKQRKHFLKFFVCQDFGYKKNIFFDADLLCVNSLSYLVEEEESCDFRAVPALVKSSIFAADGSKYAHEKYVNFRRTHLKEASPTKNYNSGVFIAKNKCLAPDFLARLLNKALSEPHTGDQPVFNKVLSENMYTCSSLPGSYNVERPYYAAFGKEAFEEDLPMLHLLHYTGQLKPWAWFDWKQNEVKDVRFMYELYLSFAAKAKAREAELFLRCLESGCEP